MSNSKSISKAFNGDNDQISATSTFRMSTVVSSTQGKSPINNPTQSFFPSSLITPNTQNTSPSTSPLHSHSNVPTHQSSHATHAKPSHTMQTRAKNNIFKPNPKCTLTAITTPHLTMEPTCVSKALKTPEWRQAMSEEFNALLRNRTWVLMPPTPQQNVVALAVNGSSA